MCKSYLRSKVSLCLPLVSLISCWELFLYNRVYHRVTITFTSKELLAKCLYLYYDWFRTFSKEKGLLPFPLKLATELYNPK